MTGPRLLQIRPPGAYGNFNSRGPTNRLFSGHRGHLFSTQGTPWANLNSEDIHNRSNREAKVLPLDESPDHGSREGDYNPLLPGHARLPIPPSGKRLITEITGNHIVCKWGIYPNPRRCSPVYYDVSPPLRRIYPLRGRNRESYRTGHTGETDTRGPGCMG